MIKGLNSYGAYVVEQVHGDTDGLRVFKDEGMSAGEKFDYFLSVINPVDAGVHGWVRFDYNGDVFFIRRRELVSILLTFANSGTPYYWGDFGTGKTVTASALMGKLFGRVVVFRMLRNMTPVELFGQYDPIAVHTTVKLMEGHIKRDVVSSVYGGEDVSVDDFYSIPSDKVLRVLPDIISKVKQVNFQFSNAGKALEENAGLLIDEVDKVTDYELTPLSSITQSKDRYVPIPDFGAIEFKQPVMLLGNSKDINRFIKSRVVMVRREHLPVKLFKELLLHEGVSDGVVIEKIVDLYKYVESGELSIRDLINSAKNLQAFYSKYGGLVDPDVEQALLPMVE